MVEAETKAALEQILRLSRLDNALSEGANALVTSRMADIHQNADAALAAAPSPSAWQPIESVPRDGTEFQAWFVLEGSSEGFWEPQCRFEPETGGFIVLMEFGWDTYPAATPTHWMPIPSSPTGGAL